MSRNEKLKTHLKKYKNTSVNVSGYTDKFQAFNHSVKDKKYDIVVPVMYDITAVSKHWDSKIRKMISDKDYIIADKLPLIKKAYVDRIGTIFKNKKILACKEEYYQEDSKRDIFNTRDVIDFSYIICYRHSPDRMKNLLKVIDWLENFNCEIVIVEQDISKKFGVERSFINHIFTKSNKPFNRSWAFNCGALKTKSDIIVCGDCDLIIDVPEFNDCVYYMRTSDCQCLSPFKTVIDLKQDESEIVNIDKWKDIQRKGRIGVNLTGGIVLYKKPAFMNIAGWNEDFEGWGGEDDYMSFKSQSFLKCGVKPYRCYHMWHPPAKKVPELYSSNLKILRDVRKRDKNSFLKEFEERRDIIGNVDKNK